MAQTGSARPLTSVSTMNFSSSTGTSSGAPRSFQSGNSSFIARGSMTAPERMCAPTSEPFSSTTMASSSPFSCASCCSRIAADRPEGPPPTITTSTSIASRSMSLLSSVSFSLAGRLSSARVTCPPVTFPANRSFGGRKGLSGDAIPLPSSHKALVRTIAKQSARATPTTLKRPQFMPEALNSLPYDPALWAEAVAWQQECGVFDTLTAAPVDAIALRAAALQARPEVARDATSRPEAQPATRAEAPAEIRAEIRVAAESTSAAAAPRPTRRRNLRPRPPPRLPISMVDAGLKPSPTSPKPKSWPPPATASKRCRPRLRPSTAAC